MALPRIVWLLVDGLPHELVRAYSAACPGSGLAALHAQHRTVPLTPLAPNCQTPPSLFTIWSGRESEEHRLLGYDVPQAVKGDPTAYVEGFQAWPRDIRMVWDLYADQLHTIRTCAAPFVQPDRLWPWLLSATDVFRPPLAAPRVLGDGEILSIAALALNLRVEANDREIVLLDDQGCECWRCAFSSGQPEEPWLLSVAVAGDTHLALRLRGAWIDGQPKLIFLGYHPVLVHGTAAEARTRRGRATPYVVANPGKLYAGGELGRRIDQGGQGLAEELLVSLMHDVHDSFAADILGAVQAGDADLVVGYYPVIDLLCHQLLRHAVRNEQLNGPLAGAFLEVMDWLDKLIAALAERIGPQVRFIVNSDHGMLPIAWEVSPNVLFAKLGWIASRPDGAIDPTRSIVFFHPAENGLLVFHRERLRDIGMTAGAVIDLLATAVAAAGLPGLKTIPGAPAPLGEAWQSDLYLQSPPGARARANLHGELVKRSTKGGDHTVCSSQPWLRGTLIDAGMTRWLPPCNGELALAQLLPLVMAATSLTGAKEAAGMPDEAIPSP
ncbi:Type I phosphodiesterase / nucleotide pyrophosphatase [Variovorax sp. PBL-H6]|uniref:alkaline phosphatase family protein n=1 Tax=Variovorax sp. PBL-H6 TaxID=434009 RepID=UPI00131605D8|nr:alkaline phosphatase family protein [Variovorax sp. PBL-H6]VTU34550.1 Type I phosphodiesterase / nucleotide pyrophosphatase [Variovorax sp. PBL-H6]